jgi:hypothetical protein
MIPRPWGIRHSWPQRTALDRPQIVPTSRKSLRHPFKGHDSATEATTSMLECCCDRRAMFRSSLLLHIGASAWRASAVRASIIDEDAAQRVFEASRRSVVSVADYGVRGGTEVLEGIGTGFTWDSYSHVVTNYHCISKFVLDTSGKKASEYSRTTSSMTSRPAHSICAGLLDCWQFNPLILVPFHTLNPSCHAHYGIRLFPL